VHQFIEDGVEKKIRWHMGDPGIDGPYQRKTCHLFPTPQPVLHKEVDEVKKIIERVA
jgi:hypothetical protein